MPPRRCILSNVDRPPDTSVLAECDEHEHAATIRSIRARLSDVREPAAERGRTSAHRERILAAIHRLDSPYLRGYRWGSGVMVSEPFNALPCAAVPAPESTAEPLVGAMLGGPPSRALVRALLAFGEPALRLAVAGGVRIALVPEGRAFAHYSDAVARLVPGIDAWPSPPAGLFVVEERRVLLRGRAMAMTAAHEFAHALDALLARKARSYHSYEDAALRDCFARASGFVNEYAASSLDEYFAESVRAYVEVNDARCMWLPLTRCRLQQRDPALFSIIEQLFAGGFATG